MTPGQPSDSPFAKGPWTPRPSWGEFFWSVSGFDVEYACHLLGVRPTDSTARRPHHCVYYVHVPVPPASALPQHVARPRGGPFVKIGHTGHLRDRWLHLVRTHGATQLLAFEVGSHEPWRLRQFARYRIDPRSELLYPLGLFWAHLWLLSDELVYPPPAHP